ncbi:MAG TPA: hypothetical protein VF707_17025 [Ardenticatenaceae bacterium]|jgi:hypothetical protein
MRFIRISWLAAALLAFMLLLPGASASADSGTFVADFEAISLDDHILLSWSGVGAADYLGFNLYRGTNHQASGVPLNRTVIPAGAPGNAGTLAYQWQDFDVTKGTTYYYWLEMLDPSGTPELRGPVGVLHQTPTAITLSDIGSTPATPRSLPWLALALAAMSGGAVALRRRRIL